MNIKVVHIDSGLGNQMLSYCELLAIKHANPNAKCYIETLDPEFPECNEIIAQWNGYELEKIFGIKEPNVSSLFDDSEWTIIKQEIADTEFWKKNWNYPKYFTQVFAAHGLNLKNLKGDYEDPNCARLPHAKHPTYWKIRDFLMNKNPIGGFFKQYFRNKRSAKYRYSCARPERLFLKGDDDIFTGMWLDFKFNGNKIELIHDEIMKKFVFPPFVDEKNIEMAKILDSSNSVFIHARRGDMLSANGWCYKYGFFKRAVKHIRKNVENPMFVFFTNTGSIDWCKEHAKDIFGLKDSDKVMFVDWNAGDQSFRDMQLMTHCKHGIITNSTFGWWGAYLIQNPNKITISPMAEINTTYSC
jgi:hypothetical protein